ncbi:hypothetical protein NITLEN_40358 [Nitrospira lenta]|uniref:Uncharacterized protein n=1 Tax=Nitrospira lenta TaxID=1436998 RepID=A0A330L920_9BACT|nr:hypothetical protein NITLEN_40358 [Nitrospira lenta]
MPSSKAARREDPEAYAAGYVEGSERLRTTLEGIFSSLKEGCYAERVETEESRFIGRTWPGAGASHAESGRVYR